MSSSSLLSPADWSVRGRLVEVSPVSASECFLFVPPVAAAAAELEAAPSSSSESTIMMSSSSDGAEIEEEETIQVYLHNREQTTIALLDHSAQKQDK